MVSSTSQPCPCDSQKPYTHCCGPYIERQRDPQSAEALMRSRYTAFCLGNRDYLMHSWHPDTRPSSLDLDHNARWIGLKIKHTTQGTSDDEEGTVEFVARYKIAGKAHRLQENSYFCRHNGRWVYVSAQ